jgi:hypothetical protein
MIKLAPVQSTLVFIGASTAVAGIVNIPPPAACQDAASLTAEERHICVATLHRQKIAAGLIIGGSALALAAFFGPTLWKGKKS